MNDVVCLHPNCSTLLTDSYQVAERQAGHIPENVPYCLKHYRYFPYPLSFYLSNTTQKRNPDRFKQALIDAQSICEKQAIHHVDSDAYKVY